MNGRIAMLACAVLLAGCAVAAEKRAGDAQPRPLPPATREAVPVEGAADAARTDATPDVPPPRPGTEPVKPPQPAAGEVPAALVEKMRADLQQRLAAERLADPPVVVSSEEIVWPDGGMGCGRPGEMYTMNVIPGYRVVFGVGARRYAYHASRAGAFKYCAGVPLRTPPPSAGRENPAT